MKTYLIILPDDSQRMFCDTAVEAYQLAYELCHEANAQEVGIYQLADTGHRRDFVWDSKKPPIMALKVSYKPQRQHRRWTDDELKSLRIMAADGMSFAHMAKQLGRTKKAISERLFRIRRGKR